ncbi:MAG: hypothetical protein JWP56_3000 [Aeromicrobium sp.]|nr:hypothetical protein [Aeromicrobium sp.]
MNDTTPQPTDTDRPLDADPNAHYWSMEHHSYRDQPAPHAAASPAPTRGRAPKRRNRLVAACVLGFALVAGAGSVAVAQGADAPNPDANPAQIQAAQVDHHHGDRLHGAQFGHGR